MIDDEIESQLFDYLGGICKRLECNPLRVGGYKNHVHILCQLSKKITQAKLLEEVKKQSSKWIKTKGRQYADFYWQAGYGIFSVNPERLDSLVKYINNQRAHHSNKSFKEELIDHFTKYNMEYDERYIWE